jgi:hypothetical protein
MYWLGKKLQFHSATAFAMGCMFMSCGFFIGNLQHINFLTCAAFLPWLVGAWLLYQHQPSFKNAVCCGMAAYLVCTGGHPAIPIATLYFMGLLTVLFFFKQQQTFSKPYILRVLQLLLVIAVFLLPLLLSYYRLLPHYARAEPIVQKHALQTGFTLPSFISFLFPFATIKAGALFGTDVSMRNAYFSLAGLVFFTRFLFRKEKNALQVVFLIAGLVLLLLSAGGVVKQVLYSTIPLFQYIRTNGEFRIFGVFSFLVCASYEMNKLISNKEALSDVSKLFKSVLVLAGITVLVGLFFIGAMPDVFAQRMPLPARLKAIIDQISFSQTLLIAAAVVCILSLLYVYALKKISIRYFIGIVVLDVIINSWLLLPITGVSQTPTEKIQAVLNRQPEGFPPPPLRYIPEQKPLPPQEEKWIGNWNWYSKNIVYESKIDYPSKLKSTEAFFEAGDTAAVKNKPALFLKSGNGRIEWKRFGPTKMELATAIQAPDTIVLLQNYFPGWRIWVNEKVVPITRYQNAFLQVPVNETTKRVSFRFSPFYE